MNNKMHQLLIHDRPYIETPNNFVIDCLLLLSRSFLLALNKSKVIQYTLSIIFNYLFSLLPFLSLTFFSGWNGWWGEEGGRQVGFHFRRPQPPCFFFFTPGDFVRNVQFTEWVSKKCP